MLVADNIHYSYEEAGKLHAVLKGVRLTVDDGERVALLGSSGSGKSTLLNIIGAIDTPQQGSVTIAGQAMQGLTEPDLTRFRLRHIGFVYQQFNLIPTLTTAENILLPLTLLGLPRQEQQQRLATWMEATGLEGRESAFPDQLSGGEQQRVSIARALIHQPSLVLADEPTGNLDANTGQQILDLLFDVTNRQRQSLLLVTHSKLVAERADCQVLLDQGMISDGAMAVAW